jgi:hypothetical protein
VVAKPRVSLCALFMDVIDINAVLAANGAYETVPKHVRRLHSACKTGEAVLAFARDSLASDAARGIIEHALKEVISNGMSAASVTAYFDAIAKKMNGPLKGKMSAKRDISVEFHNMSAIVPVTSLMAECEIRFWAVVRENALGRKNGLQPFAHELIISGNAFEPDLPCQVPDEVISGMKEARSFLHALIDSKKPASFENMAKLLVDAQDSVESIDRSYKVDIAVLGNSTKLLEKVVQDSILNTLPSEKNHMEIDASIQHLVVLQHDPKYKLISVGCKRCIATVHEMLGNMSEGITPDASFANKGNFYTTVLNRLVEVETVKVESHS